MRETITAITAILCITGLAALALYMGINGTVLMSSVGVIGGLGGYAVGKRRGKSITTSKPEPQSLSDTHD